MGEGCSAYIKVLKKRKSSNSPSAQIATDGSWENDALSLGCPRGNARMAILTVRKTGDLLILIASSKQN